ncbi:cytochrome P450 [Xylariaceae sp. FL0804]|nr:cytochrome P450 [Xylariaceae sp. FL0804]
MLSALFLKIPLQWGRAVALARAASIEQIAVAAIISAFVLTWIGKKNRNISNIPYHGVTLSLEPAVVAKSKFVTGAKAIVASGCQKFKNVPFIVRRFDTDYNILPIKHLYEIRMVRRSILNSKLATSQNLLSEWTGLDFLNRSDLHAEVLRRKLTPNLSEYLRYASDELDYAWKVDLPQSDDWVEVDILKITRLMMARMSARIFLGAPACRDPEWLRASTEFTVDAFVTAFVLRMFPPWMRFLVAPFVRARHRLRRHRAKAEEMVLAKIKTHRPAAAADAKQRTRRGRGRRGAPPPPSTGDAEEGREKKQEEENEKEEEEQEEQEEQALMDWMLDNGSSGEVEVGEMANRLLLMALASTHTTSQSAANFLFELCAHPEWFPALRGEIDEVNRAAAEAEAEADDGGVDLKMRQRRLERVDSFLLECFRVHPLNLLSPQRVVLQPYTLEDGTHIPKGCRIAFANSVHQMDPAVTPDPERFDPMRSYRRRQTSPEESLKSQAVLTDVNHNLTFGYGSQACPGRFFGVAEIKILVSRLIADFDFKYPEGKSMPKGLTADENVFIDPSAKLMMRRRKFT